MSTVVIRLAGGQEVVSAITRDSAESLALFNASIWRHRLGRKADAEVREPDLCT